MRDKAAGRRAGRPSDPHRGADRRSRPRRSRGRGLGQPMSASCAPRVAVRSRRAGAADRRRGERLRAAFCAADAHLFSRSASWRRPASISPRCWTGSASARRSRTRLQPFPNGAAAMRALAAARRAPDRLHAGHRDPQHAGRRVAGALPAGFELATIYTAAVAANAAEPVQARRLAALLTGEAARDARTRAGFS